MSNLNIRQIAKIANLSPSTLYGKRNRERIGLPQPVAPRRWKEDDIRTWASTRNNKTTKREKS